MRKYQQLVLVIVSCLSVAILLIYKGENNRLKDVLNLVNLFGRKDLELLNKLEITNNSTAGDKQLEFIHPLPIWQTIADSSFHAFAAYWNKNVLISGGEAVVITIGPLGGVLNFRCVLFYENRSLQGKFHFQRLHEDNSGNNNGNIFSAYIFFCRLSRDFGTPKSVAFTTDNRTDLQKLRLHYIEQLEDEEKITPELVTVCLDLASEKEKIDTTNLIQFFLHHKILGVENFIIYNADEVPKAVWKKLVRMNLSLNSLPFNFPYALTNVTRNYIVIRKIVEVDCILRNALLSRHALLLGPNDFFYTKSKFNAADSILRSLSTNVTRFEPKTFSVCINTNQGSDILVDHTAYDPALEPILTPFLHRINDRISTSSMFTATLDASKSVSLPLSQAFVHHYTECKHLEGGDGLQNWQTFFKPEFLEFLKNERKELKMLMRLN